MNENLLKPIQANSHIGISFKTELFEGKTLLLIDKKPICSQYKSRFQGQKFTFEMQVQGKSI